MFYKKNLSVYDSTFPFVWVCMLTWWIDRLLVELGHRSSDSDVCIHSDLQYVHLHQYICYLLVAVQVAKAFIQRRREYAREAQLVDSNIHPCSSVIILICQTILVCAWSSIFFVLLDVSPWLCVSQILDRRAMIAMGCLMCILMILPLEAVLWDRFLQTGLVNTV